MGICICLPNKRKARSIKRLQEPFSWIHKYIGVCSLVMLLFEVWGCFGKIFFSPLKFVSCLIGHKPKVCTICYLFLINSNSVINYCWTPGSTTEDPLILSLFFFFLRAEAARVFPTKIRHLTPRTFPEILNTAGSVTLQILSPKLLALLWANSLLHSCGNSTEKQSYLTLRALPPRVIFHLRAWRKSPSHAFVHKVTPGKSGWLWSAAVGFICFWLPLCLLPSYFCAPFSFPVPWLSPRPSLSLPFLWYFLLWCLQSTFLMRCYHSFPTFSPAKDRWN